MTQRAPTVWTHAISVVRQRRIVVATAFVAALAAGLVSFLSPRYYVARALFAPQENTATPSSLGQIASQFGLAIQRGSAGSPDFYANLLQSREVLRDVLLATYEAGGPKPFRGTLLQYFEVTAPTRDDSVLIGIQRLIGAMSVGTDIRTSTVSLSVTTKNRELSAKVADKFLELVNAYNLRLRQERGRNEREFVQERLGLQQRELDRAEDALASFRSRNRILNSPDLQSAEARLQRQVNLQQQIYLTLVQSLETARIEEVRTTPLISIIERPEGFVEKKRRGTVMKAMAAGIVGAALAMLVIVLRDLSRRDGLVADDDVGVLLRELRQVARTPWRSPAA